MSYQDEKYVQLIDISKGLVPTYITTEANAKNQEPTQSAHFAQDSDALNIERKKLGMGILIPV